MKDPLKLDPSRTTMLRRQFAIKMRQRFVAFRRAVDHYFEENEPLIPNALAVSIWLEQQIDLLILDKDLQGNPWTDFTIRQAYVHGVERAYNEINPEVLSDNLGFRLGSKNEFIRGLAGSAKLATITTNAKSQLQTLLTRAFKELEGITSGMAQRLSRLIASGLQKGLSNKQILKTLKEEIDTTIKVRALALARAEVVRANAEGKLDAYAELGITEVGFEVEWVTAGDGAVCPRCAAMEGKVMSLQEAHDQIPLHPGCRCEPRAIKGDQNGNRRKGRTNQT